MNNLSILDVYENPERISCKGVFWRGSVSTFLSQYNSIEVRRSLRLLKRMSCSGCVRCDWIWDYIKEQIADELEDGSILKDISHGKIYTYKTVSSRDWETGVEEVEEIYFEEVK